MSVLIRFAAEQKEVGQDVVDRVGGEPIGMTKETWPSYQGNPMHHVITFGRENIVREMPDNVAAVAVFIQNYTHNDAYTPDTKETAVVLLTQSDLARGTTSAESIFGQPLQGEGGIAGVLHFEKIEYKFDDVAEFEEPEDEAPEAELDEEEISSALSVFLFGQHDDSIGDNEVQGFAGDHVYWLQSAVTPDGHRVVFQFYDEVVKDLNCGTGVMYVAVQKAGQGGVAWWQC